eukprot:CAMPEP_0119053064 /NCGR_PEP_ID=MMETSP1177-20130426/74171_1 /TAXON_ID=2985 /ORGANISM="Ochromonas sp, Strain CCMP1899" /LENGTH=941 /DNA_ID=CAMNT_0007032877 /DNA_START=124 /DNA_END=2949 /DNA_ORIENTATION=+
MERELFENKSLILNDLELKVDQIPSICRFLTSKEAFYGIETLILISKQPLEDHNTLGRGREGRRTSNRNGFEEQQNISYPEKLLQAAATFIGKSLKLHTVILDSVKVRPDLLANLSSALSATKSVVRWLSFKSCPIGNMGVKILAPHVSKMHLQVLVFERCGLSDEACSYLSDILKSQEAMLDLLHWNTTLRMDVNTAAKRTEETDRVHSQGLVALSVNGNSITEEGIGTLKRAIKSNFWVLGLNIANNKIEKSGIDILLHSLRDNNALHAVLIGGNPGYSPKAAHTMTDITDKANLRLELMPKGVAMLLRRWMKLQQGEKTGGDVSFDISVDAAGVALPIFKGKDISRISKDGNKLDSKLKGDKKVTKDVGSSSGHLNGTTDYLKSINQETSDHEFPVIEKGFLERSWEEGSEDSVLLDMGSQEDLEALSTDAIVHVGEIKSRGEAWGTTEKGPSPDVNGRPTSRISARPRPSITGLSSPRRSDSFQNFSGNDITDWDSSGGGPARPRSATGDRVRGSQDRPRSSTGDRGDGRRHSFSQSPGIDVGYNWTPSGVSRGSRYSVGGERRLSDSRSKEGGRRSNSAPRIWGSSGSQGRQATISSRLARGVASAERAVPVIRAKWSPQRRRQSSFSQDMMEGERERDNSVLRNSLLTDRGVRSVNGGYYRRDVQGQAIEEREQASLRRQQHELERSIEIRQIERQHSLSSPLLSPKIEKTRRRKSKEKKRGDRDDRQIDYIESHDYQQSIQQDMMDTFNHSIQEMTAQLGVSFGVYGAQLREGFANLSESILERSHIQAPMSPTRGGTPPSGSRSRSTNNSMEINGEISSDFLGQTHGRSRGSLVHPGGGGTLFRDGNDGYDGGHKESATSGGSATWHSPNRVYNDSNNDRKDHKISKEFSPQNRNYRTSPKHDEEDVLSDDELALLIRDRMRKKLKEVLRPNS